MTTRHVPLDSPRANRKITLRLFGFVLVSLVLHGVLLLSQRTSFELSATTERTMQVTLGHLAATASPVAMTPAEKKLAPNQPRIPDQGVTPTNPVPVPPRAEQKPSNEKSVDDVQPVAVSVVDVAQQNTTHITTSFATTTTNAPRIEQQRITLNQLLTAALARHFHYPLLARKYGWQGEVLLAFTLDIHGTIINARIARGSGYSVLDSAALKSLSRVATLEIGPSQAISFELPVIYNLNGG